ncbi:hypothetical protein M3G04_09705 [Dietzia cinnamea]|uniref:hypothetical protein n=1 Tax=Dietzia cinnamea TaxID=321318 RepID=UPI00223AC303|nr:hypothetical protein [Dietzia cinnamea]MCT2301160.1 hypothetical protein [Dietzia cinnamea]
MDLDNYRDPLGRINVPLVRALSRAATRLVIGGIALLLVAAIVGAVAGDALDWKGKLLVFAPGFLATVAGVACRFAVQSRLTDLR